LELPILFRDEHYVAVHKPGGLLVHRTRIAEDAREFAMQILRNQLNQWVYPLHRLDRGTSGVLLFALHKEAAQRLGVVFEEAQADKSYLAVLRGYVPEAGLVDYALREEKYKAPQEARTEYRRLATAELSIPVGRYPTARYSLVEARPLTGRMHQIRKHFAHLCHYVIGDKRHGDWRHNQMFAEKLACPHLLLHARRLAFPHPFTGEFTSVSAPLPEYWLRIAPTLGWEEVLTEMIDP
jgi:tRNA pseudouridine65 synthase